MLSPSGRSKTFDDSADGFGRGEGCVVVACKELLGSAAAVDMAAVEIGSSGVNQDGRTATLTAPNGPSQQAVTRFTLCDEGGKFQGRLGPLEIKRNVKFDVN